MEERRKLSANRAVSLAVSRSLRADGSASVSALSATVTRSRVRSVSVIAGLSSCGVIWCLRLIARYELGRAIHRARSHARARLQARRASSPRHRRSFPTKLSLSERGEGGTPPPARNWVTGAAVSSKISRDPRDEDARRRQRISLCISAVSLPFSISLSLSLSLSLFLCLCLAVRLTRSFCTRKPPQ